MYIAISLLHAIFVLGLLFLWWQWDKIRDYKNYVLLSVAIGTPIGLIFDFVGINIFKLWSYPSTDWLDYPFILIGTYIAAVPLLIETLAYFLQQQQRWQIRTKLKVTNWYYLLSAGIGICYLGTTIARHVNLASRVTLLEYALLFFCLLVISDALLHFLHEPGLITRFLSGEWLIPIAVLASGILSGFMWELLNTQLRLWTYTDLIGPHIAGIPLVVLIFWSTLNITYWTAAKILHQLTPQLATTP